jgi:hypothetical protein
MNLLVPCSRSVLLATAASAQDSASSDPRITELERKVDVLTQELAGLKLTAATDTSRTRTNLSLGLGPSASKVYSANGVSLGGYGEMLYENFDRETQGGALAGATDRIDFLRAVVYAGYKFTDGLLFNSEIEFEHGGVVDEAETQVDPVTGTGGTELSGEAHVEFAYVDWAATRTFGVRAGMMLVPVGLTNEMHEPTTFATARRPEVEEFVIPTTWSGNGVGAYGQWAQFGWRAYMMEGLDAAHFSADEGVREGRQGGIQANATRPAFTGRADYLGIPGMLFGASFYTGNPWQTPEPAGVDLKPRYTLVDVHARVEWQGLEARALYAHSSLTDASDLSDAIGLTGDERLGEQTFGGYVEAQYDLLQRFVPGTAYRLAPYARYERYDTQNGVPGGDKNPANERTIWTVGAGFQPHPNVVVKGDREFRSNGADSGTSQWNLSMGYVF